MIKLRNNLFSNSNLVGQYESLRYIIKKQGLDFYIAMLVELSLIVNVAPCLLPFLQIDPHSFSRFNNMYLASYAQL